MTSPGPAKSSSPTPVVSPALGRRTAIGAAWLVGQTVAAKGLGLATQVVLAWLLMPEAFGLIGLTYTFATFVRLLERAGIREVLIQRRRLSAWAGPALWMSMGLGTAGGLLLAALAPAAAYLYGEPELLGLMLVVAVASPIQAASLVPMAALQRDLRFRMISTITTGDVAVRSGLSILFAWLGFGAYSFVLPVPIALALVAAATWLAARPPVSLRPRVRRWRLMLGDSLRVLGGDIARAVVNQADYIALGLFHSASVVGLYFFAFNISTQALRILTMNLSQVMFPALSKLNREPRRQLAGFLRAQRLLAVVGVPACLLQAALADPLIRLCFEPQWYAAIPLFQVLSLGAAPRILAAPAAGLINAQGRFGLYMWSSVVYAAVFAGAALGAAWSGPLSVAVTVAAVSAVYGPLILYLAVRPWGHGWRHVSEALGLPCAIACFAVGAGYVAGRVTPGADEHLVWRMVVVLVGAAVTYVPLVRWLMPATWAELVHHMAAMLPGRRRGAADSS